MHSEYHSERTATWETTSNNQIRAYRWLELRKGQTYTDDIKVMKLASMIKVGNNIALAIAVEFMKNTYRSDFPQALTYITSHINKRNAKSKSSAATRQISSAQRQKKCNGVDISDPFRNFTSDEWHQLQQQGQNLVAISYRHPKQWTITITMVVVDTVERPWWRPRRSLW